MPELKLLAFKEELECTLSLAAEENWNHLQFLTELLGKESARRRGHLFHATKEGNSARGCPCTAGHQPRRAPSERSPKPEKEGHQPNTAGGGARPRDQRPRGYPPTSVEKEREKMLRLAELQKKIDEVAEEMLHITQDEQG